MAETQWGPDLDLLAPGIQGAGWLRRQMPILRHRAGPPPAGAHRCGPGGLKSKGKVRSGPTLPRLQGRTEGLREAPSCLFQLWGLQASLGCGRFAPGLPLSSHGLSLHLPFCAVEGRLSLDSGPTLIQEGLTCPDGGRASGVFSAPSA